ncbi:hypothetical protein SAMN05443244_2316 [Terriglobus roseus]|uniref:Uncharacterized protein n=1 Tax=Terriglobus roseus TaxID=392734 RepID=A0A1H4NPV4_9BACT|nr:hypothetical protein SAMN05443244_2316 [Terriglobus roseus]
MYLHLALRHPPQMARETDHREIPDTGSLKAESYTLHCSHVSGPAAVLGKPPIDEKALVYLKPLRAGGRF